MTTPGDNRFVLAGGPGAGKTTVLDALMQHGFYCLPDVARAVIRRRLDSGLSARPEPAEFARAIFAGDVENYRSAPKNRVCFFDRGVVDALGMLRHCGELSDDQLNLNLRHYPYHKVAFIFPPWKEIYRMDSERDQTFEESVQVHQSVKTWYSRCGYEVLEVPIGTPAERVEFIENTVAAGSDR